MLKYPISQKVDQVVSWITQCTLENSHKIYKEYNHRK